MTHWLICIDNDTLYAGADRSVVKTKHANHFVAGLGVQQANEINKIVKVIKNNKSCIICCGDSGDLLSQATYKSMEEDKKLKRAPNPNYKREQITDIISNLLMSIDFDQISTANELLLQLSLELSHKYLIDNLSPILLGCGFANYSNSDALTIASYDSKIHVVGGNPIVISISGYLDMDGVTNRPHNAKWKGVLDMINDVISNHPRAGKGVDIQGIFPQNYTPQKIQTTQDIAIRSPSTSTNTIRSPSANAIRNRVLLVIFLCLFGYFFEKKNPNRPSFSQFKKSS